MTLLPLILIGCLLVPFVAYPLLLLLRARLLPQPWLLPQPIQAGTHQPAVDLVICAYNEADAIAAKLENALSLKYPKDKLTIWLASDGSADATVAIAQRYEARGVRILDLPRGGKAAALNAAVAAGTAPIIAFSDANSMWQTDALTALTQPFSDAQIGGVAGDQRYSSKNAESSGERSYWQFDRLLKSWQSTAGNAISATGAIYSIRRALFQPAPADATDDFMISTGVIEQGHRLVFSEHAVAVEPAATSRGEFRRKVRVITRGLRSVWYRRGLLLPWRSGTYAVELLIHKLWRRLTWIPAMLLLLLAPLYATDSWLNCGVAVGVWSVFVAGVLGHLLPPLQRFRPIAVASYVVMVNAACALALRGALRGERVTHWANERAAATRVGQ